jgi:hypothetical protein
MPRPIALVALLTLMAAPLGAQSPADSNAIHATALDYIDGWWSGDAERMTRALHPELAKRILLIDPSGAQKIGAMTATQLIGGTRDGGGSTSPTSARKSEVKILDIFGNAASVRIDAGLWIDYLHLVKAGGRWQIINVLWERRTAEG